MNMPEISSFIMAKPLVLGVVNVEGTKAKCQGRKAIYSNIKNRQINMLLVFTLDWYKMWTLVSTFHP